MYNIIIFIISCLRENVNKYQFKEKNNFWKLKIVNKLKNKNPYLIKNTDLF